MALKAPLDKNLNTKSTILDSIPTFNDEIKRTN